MTKLTATTRTSFLRAAFERHVFAPIVHLLRTSASPRRLGWSLAIGIAVGINPLLGSTTVVCLALAFVLRLNLIASQLTTHLIYPLQLALLFVFIRLGDVIFHTGAMPLGRDALLHAMRRHPLATTRMLWTWEWHALTVWFAIMLLVTPLLASVLTPLLRRLLTHLQQKPADPAAATAG